MQKLKSISQKAKDKRPEKINGMERLSDGLNADLSFRTVICNMGNFGQLPYSLERIS